MPTIEQILGIDKQLVKDKNGVSYTDSTKKDKERNSTLIKTPYGLDSVERIQENISPESMMEKQEAFNRYYAALSPKFNAGKKNADSLIQDLTKSVAAGIEYTAQGVQQQITPILASFSEDDVASRLTTFSNYQSQENIWENFKSNVSQEALNKVMNNLEMLDPTIAQNPYNLFHLGGKSARGTYKKRLNDLGIQYTDEELDIVEHFGDLQKAIADDYLSNITLQNFRELQEEDSPFENMFGFEYNTNGGIQNFAKMTGSALGSVGANIFIGSIPVVGIVPMLGTVAYRTFFDKRFEGLQRGWSDDKASSWALSYALAETVTECIGFHFFTKNLLSINSNLTNLIIQKALPEALQEGVQTGFEASADLINGLGYGDYKSFDDWKDVMYETATSMLIGGLIGGFIGNFDRVNMQLEAVDQQYKNLGTNGIGFQAAQQATQQQTNVQITPQQTQQQQQSVEQQERAKRFYKNVYNLVKHRIKKITGKSPKPKEIEKFIKTAENIVKDSDVQTSFAQTLYTLATESALHTKNFNENIKKQNIEQFKNLMTSKNINQKKQGQIVNVVENILSGDYTKINEYSKQHLKDKFSDVVTPEQADLLSDFVVNSIAPALQSNNKNIVDVMKELEPMIINLERARFNNQNVGQKSVLDSFSKSNNFDIKQDKIDSAIAYDNLTRATAGDFQDSPTQNRETTRKDLFRQANMFYYNSNKTTYDPRATLNALLRQANSLKHIYQEAGYLNNLSEEEWVTIATLTNKGYLPSEIVESYGENAVNANIEIQDAQRKLFPALSESEVKVAQKIFKKSSNKKEAINKGGAFLPKTSIIENGGIKEYENVILIGTDSKLGTGLHEGTHYALYNIIMTAKGLRDSGLNVSPQANKLLNTIERVYKKKYGKVIIESVYQETVADMVMDFYRDENINNDPQAASAARQLTTEQTLNNIVNMVFNQENTTKDRSVSNLIKESKMSAISSSPSFYKNLTKKEKQELKDDLRNIINYNKNSYDYNIKLAKDFEASLLAVDDFNFLRRTITDLLNNKENRAQIFGADFVLAKLANMGLIDNTEFNKKRLNDIRESGNLTENDKLLLKDAITELNKNNYEESSKLITKVILSKNISKETQNKLSLVKKEVDIVGKKLTPQQRLDLILIGLDLCDMLKVSASQQFVAYQMKQVRGGSNLELTNDILYSGDTANKDEIAGFSKTRLAFTKKPKFDWGNFIRTLKTTKNIVKNYAMSSYYISGNFDTFLGRIGREAFSEFGTTIQPFLDMTSDFQKLIIKACKEHKISEVVYAQNFTLNLFNNNREEATKFVRDIAGDEGVAQLNQIYDMLVEIKNKLDEAGVGINTIKDYIPRYMKDYEGFREYIKQNPTHPLHDMIVQMMKNGAQKEDIINAINATFYTQAQYMGQSKTPFTKNRVIKHITLNDLQFYHDPFDSLVLYINDSIRTVMMRKMFGFLQIDKNGELINAKHANNTDEYYNELTKNMTEHYVYKSVNGILSKLYYKDIENITNQNELDKVVAKYKMSKKDFLEAVAKEYQGDISFDNQLEYMYSGFLNYVASYYMQRKDIIEKAENKAKEYVNKIKLNKGLDKDSEYVYGKMGVRLLKHLADPNVSRTELNMVVKALRSLGKRESGGISVFTYIRQLNTLLLLVSNIGVSFTNLLDFGPIIKTFGLRNSLKGFCDAVKLQKEGKNLMAAAGVPELNEAFRSGTKTQIQKANELGFKILGFTLSDNLMKTTRAEAAILSVREGLQSDKNSEKYQNAKKLLDRYFYYDAEADKISGGFYSKQRAKVEEDIIKGDIFSPEVLFFSFNAVSDAQPINAFEVPPAYNEAGQLGLLCYQFSLVGLKVQEFIYSDIKRNSFDINEKGEKVFNKNKFTREVILWALCLSAVGASKEYVDALLRFDKPPKLTPSLIFGMAQYFFITEYIWDKSLQEGIATGITSTFMPDFALLDAAFKDGAHIVFGNGKFSDAQLAKYLPVVGKTWWWSLGGGRTFLNRQRNKDAGYDYTGLYTTAQDVVNDVSEALYG